MVGDARCRSAYRKSVLHSRHPMHHLFFDPISSSFCVYKEESWLTKRHFARFFLPWKAPCLTFTTDCSNARQTYFILHFSTLLIATVALWMPHKYQIMTNLIFTIPPPYADAGILAILACRRGMETQWHEHQKCILILGCRAADSLSTAYYFLCSKHFSSWHPW